MKVVLFCGGLGLRMRDAAPDLPKPMIPVGGRPILLQIMKYYAHFGHTDFILCLGYKADVIRDFFENRNTTRLLQATDINGWSGSVQATDDISNWNITFLDTGVHTSIGERLRLTRDHIGRDEIFLANYSDGLTDAPLDDVISGAIRQQKVATFLGVRPTYSFHIVTLKDNSQVVTDVQDVKHADIWINGGYFVFRREIFDYLQPGEDLVDNPFARLIREEELVAYRHEGFWVAMDTFKDRQTIQTLYEQGKRPWEVWNAPAREFPPLLVHP